MDAQIEFDNLAEILTATHDATAGQMFGKKCIKVNGKAAIALYQESLVFKLTGEPHTKALSLAGSVLWDPSGKGRPMREWVQLSLDHQTTFSQFAQAAASYAGGLGISGKKGAS